MNVPLYKLYNTRHLHRPPLLKWLNTSFCTAPWMDRGDQYCFGNMTLILFYLLLNRWSFWALLQGILCAKQTSRCMLGDKLWMLCTPEHHHTTFCFGTEQLCEQTINAVIFLQRTVLHCNMCSLACHMSLNGAPTGGNHQAGEHHLRWCFWWFLFN